jgi:surfactin synthase thioesterase subunit
MKHVVGSGQEYQQWHKILSDDVEICCVLMPGRSVRMKDAVVSTMTQLVRKLNIAFGLFHSIRASDCCCQVEEFIESVSHLLDQKPFVFFGHSMGSFVALEVARELRRRGKPMPVRIFASGAADPPVWVRRAKKEAEMSNADMTQLIAYVHSCLGPQNMNLTMLFLPR